MIILEIKGGLGNQMFQYAFYKNLIWRKKEVVCKITNKNDDFPFKLYIFPKVKFDCIDDIEYRRIYNRYNNRSFLCKLLNKVFQSTKLIYRENERLFFDKKILSFDNGILSGYFQNELYFNEVKDQIKNDFTFPYGENKLQDIISSLNDNSVSIHIRRGDYLKYPDFYGDICTLEYYSNAVDYISRKVDANYIVFSNDIAWAKKNFKLSNVLYVEKDMFDKYDDWYDMCIMSKCHHNIIANSSFSWWAAWLNEYPDKIVIAPPYFDNRYKNKKLACDDWVIIT